MSSSTVSTPTFSVVSNGGAVRSARAAQSASLGKSAAARARAVDHGMFPWQGKPMPRQLPLKAAVTSRITRNQRAITDDREPVARTLTAVHELAVPGHTRLAALSGVVIAVVVLGWLLVSSVGAPAAQTPATDSNVDSLVVATNVDNDATPTTTIMPAATTAVPLPNRVYVSGAVAVPGVVRVGEDARVLDALDLAKGATPDANLDVLNLAAIVRDGDHIHVPRMTDPPGVGGVTNATSSTANAASGAASAPAKVNLNTANAAELETLDGVGPATADVIIKYRTKNGPYKSIDELLNVSGIGPAKLDRMRDQLVL